jgi:hypothetical protein
VVIVLAETNTNNLDNESFDKNSYGRRVLHGQQSQIVRLPGATIGNNFNYSKAISNHTKRRDEDSEINTDEATENADEKKPSAASKIGNKAVETAVKTALPPGLKGLGKLAADNVLKNGKMSEAAAALFKAKKMKLYLIAGAAFFGFLLIIAIIFAVTSTGGTEASGAGFNEVSEYELEETEDEDISDDEEDSADIIKPSEVEDGEMVE